MWKSICMPNFNKISESTAEVKLLPVSENGRPPMLTILVFYFRFRFWRMGSHRHIILHLSVKFCSNRTIGSEVMTSYRIFKMAAIESEITFGFRLSDGICLRRWKSICMPNFNDISQSTAQIKLLPVSENGRPPYWNSISGFDFDVCVVIGMPFYICLPHFLVIDRSSAELWRHIHFFKMAAGSHIEFDLSNVRPPTKCYCLSQLGP